MGIRSRAHASRLLPRARAFVGAFALLSLGASCDQSGETGAKTADETSASSLTPPTDPVSGPTETPPTAPLSCSVPLPDEPPPAPDPAVDCPADPDGPLALDTAFLDFPDTPGAPRIHVEIADTDTERSRGLMYRTEMADDEGMLFSWPSNSRRSFWMKNTCIPLDMVFARADGAIVGIIENVPPMNLESRSVPCPAAYVLEVNAGFTRRYGLRPGHRIAIEHGG